MTGDEKGKKWKKGEWTATRGTRSQKATTARDGGKDGQEDSGEPQT